MAAPSLIFDDLYELVDAVMLFGGSMSYSSAPPHLATIGISRAETYWPALWWAKVLLELHGLRMHLAVGASTVHSKVGYKSRGNVFLAKAYRRWYPNPPGAVTPADLRLTPRMLAVWLADAVSRDDRGPIRLSAPRISTDVAAKLAAQIEAMGWRVSVVNSARYLALELLDREAVRSWAMDHVPPSILNPRTPVITPKWASSRMRRSCPRRKLARESVSH